MLLAVTPIHTGQKVWQSKERVSLRVYNFFLQKPQNYYPDLVYKLLHTWLQAPHFKLDCDQFVGAHDGVLVVDPSFLQEAPVCLLRFKIPQVLKGHKTSENWAILPQEKSLQMIISWDEYHVRELSVFNQYLIKLVTTQQESQITNLTCIHHCSL